MNKKPKIDLSLHQVESENPELGEWIVAKDRNRDDWSPGMVISGNPHTKGRSDGNAVLFVDGGWEFVAELIAWRYLEQGEKVTLTF